jgi:hypothetical protein
MIAKIESQYQRGKMGQGGVYEVSELRRESVKFTHSVQDAKEWVDNSGYSFVDTVEYPFMDGSCHYQMATDWVQDEADASEDILFGGIERDGTNYSRVRIYITKVETV